MNTLPASEIKRRGVAALDEYLKKGPIHIIKNNRPTYVVLSEKDYDLLVKQSHPTPSLLDLLENRPWTGKRTPKEINNQLQAERKSWDEK